MKKDTSILITSLLFVLSSCTAGNYLTSNHQIHFGVKGPVRFISEKHCPIVIDSTADDPAEIILTDSFGDRFSNQAYFTNYFFDEQNKILVQENLNKDSFAYSKYVYIYDKKGRWKEQLFYRKDTLAQYGRTVKQRDCFIKGKVYDRNTKKLVEIDEYRFTSPRSFITKKTIGKKEIVTEFTYETDSLGNKINQVVKSTDSSKDYSAIYQYLEYDNHGNWTKLIVFDLEESSGQNTMLTRVIQYY